jgi:chromosome segregation ATPase
MYIKEVNIDGFKSYAQRVCLTNFDPGFNAITGLNGSGKSNILDSLCFVMGIKNLSAVSAQSKCRATAHEHTVCKTSRPKLQDAFVRRCHNTQQ